MTKRFYRLAIFLLMAVCISGGASSEALAADDFEVSGIEPIYVEKGSENCKVTLKAKVTNNGSSDDVSFKAIGVDEEGFQLHTIKFSGQIKGGETKVFLERVKMSNQTYEQILDWEIKK
ncbi:MAG: hypothetical protein ACQERN_13870 [Thermodesulfobacteriota bacterium]